MTVYEKARQQRVREVLESLPLENHEVFIEPVEDGRLIATVVSREFDGIDEAERQEQVWDAMLKHLTPAERSAVEFVFTVSPNDPSGFADETEPGDNG